MIKKIGSGKYKVRVSVFDPKKGFSVSRERTISGNLAQAKEKEVELRSQLKQSCSFTEFGSVSTFSEAIGLYRDNLKAKGRLSIHHERKVNYLERELGHVRLSEVPDRFDVWLKLKDRSKVSINRYTEIVRACFNQLKARRIIQENPIDQYRFPKYKLEPRDRYLNQNEQLRLLNVIRENRPHIEPIVRYMLLVPSRVSELTEARREQYNAFDGTIYIPDSKADIPIYKPVLEMKEYFDSVPADCPYLFFWIDGNGNYRKFTSLRRPFQYCVKKAGLKNVRIHDLRHCAATDLYSQGIPEREIMDVAGWKTPMLSTYRHKDSLSTAQKLNRIRSGYSVSDNLLSASV